MLGWIELLNIGLIAITLGLIYTLHQLRSVKTAAEEARDYAERNGEAYAFDKTGGQTNE